MGDPAFPLSEYIVTRFDNRGGRTSNTIQERYNMKHSTIRDCVERMFGVMKQRWRVILDKMYLSNLGTSSLVIECCILLHNYLIDKQNPLSEAIHEDLLDPEANIDAVTRHAREQYVFDPSSSREKGVRNRDRLVEITNA